MKLVVSMLQTGSVLKWAVGIMPWYKAFVAVMITLKIFIS